MMQFMVGLLVKTSLTRLPPRESTLGGQESPSAY